MRNDALKDELARLRAEVKRLRRSVRLLSPDLDALLRRRGFRIYKREPSEALLLPAKRHAAGYYRKLHKYSFRLFLRDVIKHQQGFGPGDVGRYATPAVTKDYIDYLLSIRLLRKRAMLFSLPRGPVTSFGPTLEWYVAEVFRREFGAETAWGVKFKRPRVGGDYDVIANLGGDLVYAEVKSSPPKQIYDSEVEAFLDRVEDLAPELAIFLMDTELRMKDKLVPMFEAALRKRGGGTVVRMERELFHAGERIFIVNAKESIRGNLETVVARYYRKRGG